MKKQADLSEDNLFEQIVSLLRLAANNLLVSLTAFLLPLLFFLGFSFSDYPIYSSRMLVRISNLTAGETGFFISTVAEGIGNRDLKGLSRILSIPTDDAAKLRKIRYEKLKDKPDTYIVTLTVTDTSVLRKAEKGIANFFNANLFLKERINSLQKPLTESLKQTLYDITQLDSARKILQNSKSLSSDLLPFYLTSLSMDMMRLRDKKTDIQQKIEAISGFKLVSPFYIPEKPESGLFIKWITLGLATGFFCLYAALSGISYYRNKTKAAKTD